MAKSKTPGVYGKLRGAVGSASYSTGKDAKSKRRVQFIRIKPTNVTNPRSNAQVLQRIKIAPAQRFYAAYENAVPGGILSHSFQNVQYGNESRNYFMSLVMSSDNICYVPKNATRFIPLPYQISTGSLPSVDADLHLSDTTTYGNEFTLRAGFPSQGVLTVANVNALIAMGVPGGAQLTFVCAVFDQDLGIYHPAVFRMLNRVGGSLEASNGFSGYFITFAPATNDRRAIISLWEDDEFAPVAIACIVSLQDPSGKWLRSAETLKVADTIYQALSTPAALELALMSYRANSLNELNSEWYLNLMRTGQPYGSRLMILGVNGADEATYYPVVGVHQSGAQLTYSVFTVDGDPESEVICDGLGTVIPGCTAGDIINNNDNFDVEQWEASYGTQIEYSGVRPRRLNPTPTPPTPTVRHAIEVWADQACTQRPSGVVTELYVQFNRQYAFGDSVGYGDDVGNSCVVDVPGVQNPGDGYGVILYYDFDFAQLTLFEKGAVVNLVSPDAIDVTGFTFSFGPVVSDNPAIVENSMFPLYMGNDGYAMACRNSNGESVILLNSDGKMINGQVGSGENDRVQFAWSPASAPSGTTPEAPSPFNLIAFANIGNVPSGYIADDLEWHYNYYRKMELSDEYEWSVSPVVGTTQLSTTQIINGDSSPWVLFVPE